MPSMISIVVVLPAPFGPSRPKQMPGGTLNETPATAVVPGYSFTRLRTSRRAVLKGSCCARAERRACFLEEGGYRFYFGRQCTIPAHDHPRIRQVRARAAGRR